MGNDGWIRGGKGELFLWIPPTHRKNLCGPTNRVIAQHATELDFSHFKCGEDWVEVGKALESET